MFRRIGKKDPCWCGSGKPYESCHMEFDQRLSKARFMGHEIPSHKIIKTPAQIEKIRVAGARNHPGVPDVLAAEECILRNRLPDIR